MVEYRQPNSPWCILLNKPYKLTHIITALSHPHHLDSAGKQQGRNIDVYHVLCSISSCLIRDTFSIVSAAATGPLHGCLVYVCVRAFLWDFSSLRVLLFVFRWKWLYVYVCLFRDSILCVSVCVCVRVCVCVFVWIRVFVSFSLCLCILLAFISEHLYVYVCVRV